MDIISRNARAEGGARGDSDLALGCFASICRDRLADELVAFSRCFPDVGVGVHEMPRAALLPALEAGRLALTVQPGGPQPGLQSARLWRDRVMLAMGPDHRLARRSIVAPSDLSDEVFLVSRQQHGSDMHRFLSHCIRPLAPALNGVLLDLGPPRLMARVAGGEGLALICASHVEALDARLVVQPIDAPGAIFPVRAHWKPAQPAPPLSELIRILLSSRHD